VLFLKDGVIVEEGPPQQVIGDPREAATRAFLQRFHDSGGRAAGLE
jgi:polar amino acid transport system ATP-binding protein